MTYIKSLEALADPNRRIIINHLKNGPCSVNDFKEILSISQPAVSQHLAILKSAGLVAVQKEGNRRIYQLTPEGLIDLRNYINSFWDKVLDAFKSEAEKQTKGETND